MKKTSEKISSGLIFQSTVLSISKQNLRLYLKDTVPKNLQSVCLILIFLQYKKIKVEILRAFTVPGHKQNYLATNSNIHISGIPVNACSSGICTETLLCFDLWTIIAEGTLYSCASVICYVNMLHTDLRWWGNSCFLHCPVNLHVGTSVILSFYQTEILFRRRTARFPQGIYQVSETIWDMLNDS